MATEKEASMPMHQGLRTFQDQGLPRLAIERNCRNADIWSSMLKLRDSCMAFDRMHSPLRILLVAMWLVTAIGVKVPQLNSTEVRNSLHSEQSEKLTSKWGQQL